jgi:hypothetical protein
VAEALERLVDMDLEPLGAHAFRLLNHDPDGERGSQLLVLPAQSLLEPERLRDSQLAPFRGVFWRARRWSRSCGAVSRVVVSAPDCEQAVEAGDLEGGHRRLRPDEHEQLTSSRLLMPAGGKEQRERGQVDEGNRPQIDGEVAHFPGHHRLGVRGLTV